MTARREDWPARLLAFVEARRAMPFAWGGNDCALFAADGVREMTGEDFAAAFRGRYTTAAGALKALRRNGYLDLADCASRLLGDEVAPALARRGDVVLFAAAEGPALGVSIGRVAIAAGPEGVSEIPRALWARAWRVG